LTKIVFFGDPDVKTDGDQIYAAGLKEQNVDLYVNLGDNGYSGADPVKLLVKHFPKNSEQYKKLILVLGNHDDGESESDSTEEKCGAYLPEQYKSKPEFDSTDQSWQNTRWLTSRHVGDIYFIGMNSQDMDIEFKRNQYNWVLKELETAKSLKQQGKVTWIINASHKPWFTLKSSHSPYTAVREIYSKAFQDAGVNQNWHGHNHNDQAWWSMIAINQSGNAAGEQLQSFLPDGKTIDHTKPHGWTTNINGHSGHEHNKFKENATANKNVQWANDKTFSYAVVESNPTTKILNTKWKDKAGTVLYEYNISMAGGTPTGNAPIANFTYSPLTVRDNDIVSLDATSSSDSDGNIVSYQWTLSDQLVVDRPNESRATFNIGTKANVDVTLTVTDNNGLTGTKTITIEKVPSVGCPSGQCKDPITQQCRPIGPNETIENGFCKTIPNPTEGLKYKYSYKFGSKGTGNGQFQDPHDISFAKDGRVFVTDRIRNDIQIFSHDGKFISKFGGSGSGQGQFKVPYSCGHDSQDNLYVADRENNRIQKFDSNNNFLTEIKTINGKNLNLPEDVVFDPVNGDIYICDTGNNRVCKLDKNHNFILEFGSKGSGDGQFDHPHSSAVGSDRNYYVNSGNQPYIQKFTPDGKFIKKWGKAGTKDGELLTFLEHMDIDKFDRLHIINNNARPVIQVFDLEGKYLAKYGMETEGSADGQFREPEHITCDSEGKPFVVDAMNQRVQVFSVEGGTLPQKCPDGQCKDKSTGQCRLLGSNERVDANGFCETIPPIGCPTGQCKDPNTLQCRFPTADETIENGFCKKKIVTPPAGKLTPISVAASGQDLGKEASKAIDGDFESRWTCNGDGAWIEFKFDKAYPITKVKLTGYHYDKTYFFEINGKRFENVAGRPINSLVEYDLTDLKINSDTIRIIGHGNNVTTYNSYREIEFYTGTDPRHCPPNWHYDETLKKCIPDLEPRITPGSNKPPIANAGQDQTVVPKSTVTLNGLASSDPDGTISSYSWTQISGPTVSITNSNSAVATFIAPEINTNPNNPVAQFTYSPTNPTDNQQVTLNSMNSTGTNITRKWSITDQLVISNPTGTITTFNIGTKRSVDVTLLVTDSNGLTATKTVTIVNSSIPSTELDAEAEALILAKVGETVLLKDNGSKGAITRHEWLKETPDAQAIQLIADSSAKFGAKFLATSDMVNKDIKFKLRVFDAQNNFNDDITGTKVSITTGTPSGGFGEDAFGMKMLFKPTGKKVAMEHGSEHENGKRYNVNHEFHNYIMQGYFKLGKGQEKINHKGDGPNHGGCSDKKICAWYELDYTLATGKGELQLENPHPTNNDVPDSACEFVKTLAKAQEGQWIGWATAYFWGPDGKRHIRAYVDLKPFADIMAGTGKPLNNWQELVFAIEKGQIFKGITHPRNMQEVIDHEAGLESEIRMHRATQKDTKMNNVFVFEIDPKAQPLQSMIKENINWEILPDKGSRAKKEQDEQRDRELGLNCDKPKTKSVIAATTAAAASQDLIFQLRVTDNKGASSTDTVRITVSDGVQPPQEVDAKFPELLAKAKPGNVFVLDGSASSGNIVNWSITQTEGPTVNLIDNPKKCSKQFIMPNAKVSFTLNVNSPTKSDSDSITVNPDNDQPQPTGDVLWDSNIHLKTGQDFKITGTYKAQTPDSKGIFMAASGSPYLDVKADGTFYLTANAGHGRAYIRAINYNAMMEGECMFPDDFNVVRNSTWRLRSRHNEGGSNENKFGGFGATCEVQEQLAEYATEPYHNVHENDIKKPLAKKIERGKWFKFRYQVCDSPDGKKVLFKTEYDYLDGNGWVKVLEGEHPNPKPYYMDKALYAKESYAWLRINNESTGKVAYRNVRIIKITSIL
jgi:K319-like protein/PKD domain-containing protein/6-bladed beta-propeller protein/calcineurin-like phosphoesterase family protein/NHL repeat-containing protein